MSNEKPWTLEHAAALCKAIEKFAPAYGCHVALTGGCLYKGGSRKDVDIVLYRIRQVKAIDLSGLRVELAKHNILMDENPTSYESTWVLKGTCERGGIDFFFPESTFTHQVESFDEPDDPLRI